MGEISYRPLIEAMTWSYSRLEIFDDCPYRWFLTYIHTPKLKKEDKFYAAYGLFMHDLDKRVEKMLNEEGYAKSDFIIVRVVDYTIDATAYTNTDVNADTSNDMTLLRAEK